MRILIVNHFAVLPEEAGGTRHFSLGRELAALGHEVTIVASGVHYQSGQNTPFAPGQKLLTRAIEGVRFIKLNNFGNEGGRVGRLLTMLDFSRVFLSDEAARAIGPIDVVYGSTPHPFAAAAAARFARRRQLPFVLEIRDLWPESIVAISGVSARHPLVLAMGFLERRLCRTADHVVTLLPGSAARIGAKGADLDRITTIPNMVSLDRDGAPVPPPMRDTFIITYAGAHGLANALDSYLDAAKLAQGVAALGKARFRLIGAGPEKKRLMQRAIVEQLANVEFLDSVPKNEIGRVFSDSDAFYMPLKATPLFHQGISPNKLFDYMAAARPVVFAVDTPVNPVQAAGAGVTIPAESPAALVDALLELIAMPVDERRQMGERGRRYVRENHCSIALGARLDRVLSSARRTTR